MQQKFGMADLENNNLILVETETRLERLEIGGSTFGLGLGLERVRFH